MRFSEVNHHTSSFGSRWQHVIGETNRNSKLGWKAAVRTLGPDGRNLNWTQNLISFIVKHLN